MNTTTDLADGSRKLRAVDVRRTLRRSYETRVSFWQAAVASSFFVVVLGAGFFLGVVMVAGAFRAWDTSNPMTADGRTGRIARPLGNGTLCHYVVFDNKTAMAVEDRVGRCDEGKPKPKPEKPQTFSWGGK
jgi:hypothetical protein